MSLTGQGLLDSDDVLLADIRDPECLALVFAQAKLNPLTSRQEIIQSQDAGTQERLKQLRQYLKSEIGGYPYAITAHARVTQKPEDLARQIKDAKTAAASLEQFERTQLGPL